MSDFKSKLPDFEEITSMTSKLFKGIKASVGEIIADYKQKRAQQEEKEETVEVVKETTVEVKEKKVAPDEKPENNDKL